MNSSEAKSTNNARFDWLPRVDFILDYQAKEVWPLILRWDQWIKDYQCKHVSGSRNQVGEVKKVSKLNDDGRILAFFYIETVRLEPGQRLVSRILPLEAPAFGAESVLGYEIFNLYDLNGKTLVTYETTAQVESSLITQEEFTAAWQQSLAPVLQAWSKKYIPELRRLLEAEV